MYHYYDLYSPKKREAEIRELLTMTNGELRRLDLGRDELLAELEKFDYRAAALERMFRQDHGV